jgi:hypothetical protein
LKLYRISRYSNTLFEKIIPVNFTTHSGVGIYMKETVLQGFSFLILHELGMKRKGKGVGKITFQRKWALSLYITKEKSLNFMF